MRNNNFKRKVAFLLTGAMAFGSLPLAPVAAGLNNTIVAYANTAAGITTALQLRDELNIRAPFITSTTTFAQLLLLAEASVVSLLGEENDPSTGWFRRAATAAAAATGNTVQEQHAAAAVAFAAAAAEQNPTAPAAAAPTAVRVAFETRALNVTRINLILDRVRAVVEDIQDLNIGTTVGTPAQSVDTAITAIETAITGTNLTNAEVEALRDRIIDLTVAFSNWTTNVAGQIGVPVATTDAIIATLQSLRVDLQAELDLAGAWTPDQIMTAIRNTTVTPHIPNRFTATNLTDLVAQINPWLAQSLVGGAGQALAISVQADLGTVISELNRMVFSTNPLVYGGATVIPPVNPNEVNLAANATLAQVIAALNAHPQLNITPVIPATATLAELIAVINGYAGLVTTPATIPATATIAQVITALGTTPFFNVTPVVVTLTPTQQLIIDSLTSTHTFATTSNMTALANTLNTLITNLRARFIAANTPTTPTAFGGFNAVNMFANLSGVAALNNIVINEENITIELLRVVEELSASWLLTNPTQAEIDARVRNIEIASDVLDFFLLNGNLPARTNENAFFIDRFATIVTPPPATGIRNVFQAGQSLDNVVMNPANLNPVPSGTAFHLPQHHASSAITIANPANIGDVNQSQRDTFNLHHSVNHVQPGSNLQFVINASHAEVIQDSQVRGNNQYVEFSVQLNNAIWDMTSSGLRGFGNFVYGPTAQAILAAAGLPLNSTSSNVQGVHRTHEATNPNSVVRATGVHNDAVGPNGNANRVNTVNFEGSWLRWEANAGRQGGGRLSGPGWAIDQTGETTGFLQIWDIQAFRQFVGNAAGVPGTFVATPRGTVNNPRTEAVTTEVGATLIRFPLIIRTQNENAISIQGAPLSPGTNVFAVPHQSILGSMPGLGTVNIRGAQAVGRTNTVARNTGTHRHTLNFDLVVSETFLNSFGTTEQQGVRAFDLIAPSGFSWGPRTSTPAGQGGNYTHHVGNPNFVFTRFNNNNVLRVELTGLVSSQQGMPLGQIVLNNLVLSSNAWETTPDQDVYITIRDSQQRTGEQIQGVGSGSHVRFGGQVRFVPAGTGNLVPISAPNFGPYVRVADANAVLAAAGWPTLSQPLDIPAGQSHVWENTLIPYENRFGQAINRWNVVAATTGAQGTFAVNQTVNSFVTEQQINVGRVEDWAIRLTALSDNVPTLLSGRLYEDTITGSVAQHHRAVRVRVEENIQEAAHQERTLTLSLPEGVRIREARFFNVLNVAQAAFLTGQAASLPGSGRHFNLNNSDNPHVRINNNEIHVTGLTRTGANDNRIRFDLDLYLTIEPGFTGDVNLSLGGSAARNNVTTPYVTIAEVISPITVTADARNIRVGYQFVPVGNFSITETVAGALLPHQDVHVSITDGLFTEMQIAPGFNWEVTAGNIQIANMRVSSALAGIWQGAARPNVSFEIAQASSVPSTISFSNVQVRLTAVAPDSNVGYDIVVWGPAVANNFEHPLVTEGGNRNTPGSQSHTTLNRQDYSNFVNRRDLFNVPGFAAPFITIGDVAQDTIGAPVIFTQDGVITVGGTVVNFPADQWGSFEVNEDGVSVLPARLAFALLLGAENPYDPDMFTWNNATSTFLIDQTGRNIWLQVGNEAMGVGGVQRTILSGTGANAFPYAPYVNPETSRMMIPVRAFAEALGLNVEWNAANGSVTLTTPAEAVHLPGTVN